MSKTTTSRNQKRIFVIDIDGTICEDIRNEAGPQRMREAKPFADAIKRINQWYLQGHYICFFTARTNKHRRVTLQWLKFHKVNYHQLICDKPRRIGPFTEYHYIDNAKVRATTYNGRFSRLVKRNIPIEVFEP